MTDINTASKIADAAMGVSWFAYFLSHIVEFNAILQFFALIAAITSGICAAWYHVRKGRSLR
jgi:hypothetical protein